jgi:hypothetical protein
MFIDSFIRKFIRRIEMSNRAKFLQGFVIVVILMGMVGAVAYLAPAVGSGLERPVLAASTGNPNLTSGSEPVMYASVAWNHWNWGKQKSVAWNRGRRG